MKITNSASKDIDEILLFYEIATEYMKERSVVVWPKFERAMVEKEIAEHNQWKMVSDGKIACIWATAYRDPQIWEEKDKASAVYIHRIATNPDFRGKRLTDKIVKWAITHAREKKIKYVRLDTVSENHALIRHYKAAGFDFLGMFKLKNPTGLPEHYQMDKVALFELKV